jgi:hypothetical protein
LTWPDTHDRHHAIKIFARGSTAEIGSASMVNSEWRMVKW